MNGFTPNSHGRRIWSLAWTSLNFRIKGQSHHRQKGTFGRYLGNHQTDLWQIYTEDVFCPLLQRVSRSRSPWTGQKTAFFAPFGGLCAVCFWQNIFSLDFLWFLCIFQLIHFLWLQIKPSTTSQLKMLMICQLAAQLDAVPIQVHCVYITGWYLLIYFMLHYICYFVSGSQLLMQTPRVRHMSCYWVTRT